MAEMNVAPPSGRLGDPLAKAETAMATMKKLEEMTEPDFPSTGFGVFNRVDGTSRQMVLADFHKHAASIQINESAPEDVRSYMEVVKTLFAYGWFYYPFFTLSAFMATTAVEMALKLKFQERPDDRPSLKALFDRAIHEGLLQDEDFPSRGAVRANAAEMFGESEETGQTVPVETAPSYTDRVAHLMRHFRNVFAHPAGPWILVPGQAIDFLVLAGEVINQLWPVEMPSGPAGRPNV